SLKETCHSLTNKYHLYTSIWQHSVDTYKIAKHKPPNPPHSPLGGGTEIHN
ncbi:Hypothetical predicted protein, partial [Pelobates cultripes]